MTNIKFQSLSWLVAILVPFALIGLGLRVLLTPLFLQVEYNMPYFPPDEYGFTKEDHENQQAGKTSWRI